MSYYSGVSITRGVVWSTILSLVVAGAATAAAALEPARVVARITTGRAPCSENGGLGYLWVSNFKDATVARVDPATNRITGRVKVGARPCGVAIGAGALWVDGYGTDAVERVDPRSLRVVERIPVGPSLWDVEFGPGSVWATSEFNGRCRGSTRPPTRSSPGSRSGGRRGRFATARARSGWATTAAQASFASIPRPTRPGLCPSGSSRPTRSRSATRRSG